MLTISVSGSSSSVEPDGSFRSEAWIWVPTSAPSMSTSTYSGMWVASASSWTVAFSVTTSVSRAASPFEVDGDLDGDLLAAADGDEVDVLEVAVDRVDLDLLGQRQLGLALDVELEQRVRAAVLEGHHRVVAREGDVDRLVAVAVDDGGDLVLAADAAGGALAELGARLGGDLLGGHATTPRGLLTSG